MSEGSTPCVSECVCVFLIFRNCLQISFQQGSSIPTASTLPILTNLYGLIILAYSCPSWIQLQEALIRCTGRRADAIHRMQLVEKTGNTFKQFEVGCYDMIHCGYRMDSVDEAVFIYFNHAMHELLQCSTAGFNDLGRAQRDLGPWIGFSCSQQPGRNGLRFSGHLCFKSIVQHLAKKTLKDVQIHLHKSIH